MRSTTDKLNDCVNIRCLVSIFFTSICLDCYLSLPSVFIKLLIVMNYFKVWIEKINSIWMDLHILKIKKRLSRFRGIFLHQHHDQRILDTTVSFFLIFIRLECNIFILVWYLFSRLVFWSRLYISDIESSFFLFTFSFFIPFFLFPHLFLF